MNSSMRKKDKLIEETDTIESIIKKASVCRLGMSCDDQPYVVPMCFGYKNNALYLHSAPEGLKIEYLKKNNKVCFEIDTDVRLTTSEKPCNWGMKFKSIIGFGKAFFLEAPDEKEMAIDIIMENYSKDRFTFPEAALKATAIIKIEIESITGKQASK